MRVCATCGKKIIGGCMTDEFGDFYTHEGRCFTKYMDKTYGEHRWMELGGITDDGYGGYYIHTSDVVGGYEGTGIFYTEYEEDDLDY